MYDVYCMPFEFRSFVSVLNILWYNGWYHTLLCYITTTVCIDIQCTMHICTLYIVHSTVYIVPCT